MSIHDQKLYQAIDAIKAGDKDLGKQLLIEILKVDQRNEAAWLWMSQAVNGSAEKAKCLQNVLKINPENEIAKKALEQLDRAQTKEIPTARPQLPPPTLPTPQPKQIKSIKPLPKKLPDPPAPTLLPPALSQPESRPVPPMVIPQKSDRQLIEEAIAKYTARGFQVVSQTETSVQLRKPKQWSQLLLALGCLTLIVGFGLLILIVAAVDYGMKKEQVVFITAHELRYKEAFKNQLTSSNNQNLVVVIVVAAIIFICSVMLCGPAMLQNARKATPRVTPIVTPAQ